MIMNDGKTWTSAPRPDAGPVVSVASRALRYGDGVFVTLGILRGVLLDTDRQLRRLWRSAAAIGLEPPDGFEGPRQAARTLAGVLERLGADAATDGVARVQWSAGGGVRGFGRADMVADALVDLGRAPAFREPALVVLGDAEAPLPALPRLKSCSALAAVVCARAAHELGADEGIRTTEGLLLEGSAANLFWLRDSVLYTPDAALPLYAGSVRERVIECALDGGLGVEEGEYAPEELAGADAVLLTNAARGVETARSCDGEDLPEPPPVVAALAEAVEARRIADGLPLEGPEGPEEGEEPEEPGPEGRDASA